MDSKAVLGAREESLARLRRTYGDDLEPVFAERRYRFIAGVLNEALQKPKTETASWSDRIDRVVLNRWLGIPIFLAVMWLIFQLVTPTMGGPSVFTVAGHLMDGIDAGFAWLAERASAAGGWGGALLADGIIGGVGAVVIFVPSIFLLFFLLALLEDSGYMSRVAFVVDQALRSLGLQGKSALPMVLGLGCTVPAIMATRTIASHRDRMVTMLVLPFVSCSARLPIYLVIAGTFFPRHAGTVIFGLYVIGILFAVGTARLLRSSLFRGEADPFVMELPPYRLPRLRDALIEMWERGKDFLVRAGTIIFAVVVAVWLLDYTGCLEPIGRAIAPIFAPAGFGEWQPAVALITGILAKEVVVGTLGALFGAGEGVLGDAIAAQLGWSALNGFSFMVFTLLTVPCVATLGAIHRETNSWRWPLLMLAYYMGVAWLASTVIFQIGRLIL